MFGLEIKNMRWLLIITLVINIISLVMINIKSEISMVGYVLESQLLMTSLLITSIAVLFFRSRLGEVLAKITRPDQVLGYSLILLTGTLAILVNPEYLNTLMSDILITNLIIAIYVNTFTIAFLSILLKLKKIGKKYSERSELQTKLLQGTILRNVAPAPKNKFKYKNILFAGLDGNVFCITEAKDADIQKADIIYKEALEHFDDTEELCEDENEILHIALDNTISTLTNEIEELKND